MIKLKAVKGFAGPDGNFRKGEVFEVPAERANWLTNAGFAERTEKVAPKATPAKPAKPAE